MQEELVAEFALEPLMAALMGMVGISAMGSIVAQQAAPPAPPPPPPPDAPMLGLDSYSWEAGQPYEPSSNHLLSVTLTNLSTQGYTYQLVLLGGARTISDSITLAGGETATWEAAVPMPSQEGYHEFRLIVDCAGFHQPFSVGTVEVRGAGPPPEEAEFAVQIVGVESPAPVGEVIVIHVAVTNLSNQMAGCDMLDYLDGVPSVSSPWHIDAIPPGATVINPGFHFLYGRGRWIRSLVPQTATYEVCVMSIPTHVHRNCDSTALAWM